LPAETGAVRGRHSHRLSKLLTSWRPVPNLVTEGVSVCTPGHARTLNQASPGLLAEASRCGEAAAGLERDRAAEAIRLAARSARGFPPCGFPRRSKSGVQPRR